jgi:AsmA protein
MKAIVKLLAVAVGGALIALALVPWELRGAARHAEVRAEIETRTGLDVRIGGPIKIKLLPRPRVQMADVSISARDGTVMVDAPMVYGDLDIPSALHGRLRLISATLSEPTLTVDLDAGTFPAPLFDAQTTDHSIRPFRLSIRAAVLRLRSAHPGSDTLLTDVDATAHHGGGPTGGLALSGAGLWHGARGQLTLLVARPDVVLKGGSSPLHLQITSPLGAFMASGDLTGGAQAQFAGRLSASTPDLPRLFTALGLGPAWVNVQRASVSGEALAKPGDLSLSESALRLDDTAFEGTLGFHGDGGRGLIEGTLATNLLDINKLAGRNVDRTALSALCHVPFSSALTTANLDLRISASSALIGHTDIQDAALSALFRDGRLEVTVDEAHAYDGVLKARAVALLHPWGAEAHGEITLSRIDMGSVTDAWSGRETIAGAMSGKLAVDGRGNSVDDLVHSLTGEGQATIEHGRFVGVSVSQALKRLTRRLPLTGGESGQVTSFASASTGIGIVGGVMHLIDGKVIGPGIKLEFGGQTDLPRGNVDITAVATQTDAAGSIVPDGPRLPFEMRGTWGSPLLIMQRGRSLMVPPLPLPSLDDQPDLP